ncbi:MAG: LTA synthase family protein [Bacillota bacterium]
MLMPTEQRAPMSPLPTSSWRPVIDRASLVFIAMAAWLIFKQRLALSMLSIPPGPGMMLASAGAILFLSAWVRTFGGRWQTVLWLLLSGLTTLISYADILYYRQFGDLVSIASLRYSGQLGDVASSVVHLLRASDLWLWADLPLLAALLFLPAAHRTRWFAPARARIVRLTALAGLLVVALVAKADPILAEKYYGHTMVGSRMGLLNYHAFDAGAYAGRLTARLGAQTEAVQQVQAWFEAKRQSEPPAASPLAGVAKGKNVIVLQVESFQTFPVGMKIGEQEVTPNLNRLMTESVSFPNFYHQTGQGVTADADLLANCSLHPTRTGAVYYDYAHNRFRCMPTVLREEGYAAVAMQGMPADFWNLSAVYPQVGFERYYSIRDYVYDEKIGIGLSDESFLRQSVEKLKGLPEPYYAFVVTLTSHGPFDFDNLPRTLDLGDLEGTKAGWYLHNVHYTDRAIGLFLDRLKAEGILDESVLVVYGDHQGVWRYDQAMDRLLMIPGEDEVAWVQAEKRVPLMIRLPGGEVTGVRTQAAGQVDLAPTIAGLLGIATDDTYFTGRDLFATGSGIVPFYRGSAADDTHLYLSADDGPSGAACYLLETRQPVELEACEELKNRAERQLAISRLIVERDLIPALRLDQ